MYNAKRSHRLIVTLLLALLLSLLALGVALAATGNIDATNKWAWGANVGWVNFAPENGGVTVYADHLEGYAWAENVGWIRLGTHIVGGTHTYANTSATDYGVNRNAGTGALSGYAWSTTAGWINFAPTNGGVTISGVPGDFSGYAWGENIGWIKFNSTAAVRAAAGANSGVTYKVSVASAPTGVTVADFSAEAFWGSGPQLRWETADESGLAGFHVWRGSAEGAETRLTDALIGAVGGLTGSQYTWQDAVTFTWGQRTHYWLEAVEGDGSSRFTGPVEVLGIGRLFLPSVGR